LRPGAINKGGVTADEIDEDDFLDWMNRKYPERSAPEPAQPPEPAPPKRTRSSDRRPVRRGPRAKKLKGVLQQMRHEIDAGKLTLDALADFPEKALAARYGVGRDTVRKARDVIDPTWSERRK